MGNVLGTILTNYLPRCSISNSPGNIVYKGLFSSAHIRDETEWPSRLIKSVK